MPTVTKTWVFLSTLEGIADVGDSATLTIAADAANGNPAGSADITGTNSATGSSERFRRATTGETWETWGVPTGSTVTNVQINANTHRWATSTLTSQRLRARVVDTSGVSVLAADSLDVSPTIATDGAGVWVTNTGTLVAVNAGSQPSTTDVRVEMQYSIVGTGTPSPDIAVDNLAVVITYTAGAATVANSPRSFQAIPVQAQGRNL